MERERAATVAASSAGSASSPEPPRRSSAPAPSSLQPGFFSSSNLTLLTEAEKALVQLVLDEGQAHVFEGWERLGVNDDKKLAMMQQLARLERGYPGGIRGYLSNARKLLEDAKAGSNPFEGWRPEVPEGVDLVPNSWSWNTYESAGLAEISKTGFVLVAGGLGERLGYGDIKIGLPVESASKTTYLEYYCKQIKAMEERYCKNGETLPLAIMVSGDTIQGTRKAVDKISSWFPNITLLCQEKVAALLDNSGTLALNSTYEIDTKPHGHGDVHTLMHSSGTAKAWLAAGKKWCVFFQDTNALAFHALPAMLGVSESRKLEVNSLAIPRVAKQAVGAITKLKHTDGRSMTVNVEYNQLDPLLRATINPDGDVNDPSTGFSPFPGNINQLVFAVEPYCATLESTQGILAEFVNPKYADAKKEKFKKPTRLECMMQDYPKVLLERSAQVGFSTAPAWICYSPCKNNAKDAAASAAQGVPAGSAWTAESDQYWCKAEMLRQLGANVTPGPDKTFLGISAAGGARIVVDPTTASFFTELKVVFPSPSSITISDRSTLLLSGDVVVESLNLDGRLRIAALPGTKIIVRAGASADRQIFNAGDRLVEIPTEVTDSISPLVRHYSEVDLMRGFTLVIDEEEVVTSLAAEREGSGEGKAEGDAKEEGVEECCVTSGGDSGTWADSSSATPLRTLVFTGKQLVPAAKYRADSSGLFCC